MDPATGATAGRIPYGTPFSLAVTLPENSDARLAYWPHGRKQDCATARTENKDYVIERLGVATGTTEDGQRKYLFAVDPLRVNASYCFGVEYTTYTPLSARQRDLVADGITRALARLLEVVTTPATAKQRASAIDLRYAGYCEPGELEEAKSATGKLPGCMLVGELGQQAPELRALQVRVQGRPDAEPFMAAFERRLAEDVALRTLLGDTLRKQQLGSNLLRVYGSDLAQARGAAAGAPVEQKPELERALSAIPDAPMEACARPVEAARTVARCDAVQSAICGYLGALKTTCDELDPLTNSDLLDALVTDMKHVLSVKTPARPIPLTDPDFDEWINFHASLDVGAAAVPFRADAWGVAQYLGVNFYFTAVDRNERLTWRTREYRAYGGREFLKRLSLTLGITTTGATLRTEDGVSGALGNQFLLYGVGFRVFGGLRLSAGGVLYKQSSQNPARGDASAYRTSPFIGLSFDIDLFRWIGKAAGTSK